MATIGAINWSQQARTESLETVQWGRDETRAVLVADTDFANILNGTAVKTILGFSARTGLGLLSRLLPMQCPLDGLSQCYATKITDCKFWSPKSGDAASMPKRAGLNGSPFTNYTRARLTVLFETLPYDVYDDATYQSTYPGIADEFYRWTLILPYANVETIVRPGNSFKFANGPAGIINAPFPQGLVVRVQKRDLVVKWFQVPRAARFDLGLLNPFPKNEPWNFEDRQLSNTVGFVNQFAWHGYRPGEVLLKPSRVEPVAEPVPPQVLGLNPGAVPRCYNYEFHFQIFQPPYDPVVLNANGYTSFGHNTMPPVSAAVNGYFYQGSRGGSGGINDPLSWLYPVVDFTKLFQSVY